MHRMPFKLRGLSKTLLLFSLFLRPRWMRRGGGHGQRFRAYPGLRTRGRRGRRRIRAFRSCGARGISDIPEYSGSPYVEVSGNVPSFTDADLSSPAETYAPLDSLGRCGSAMAIVSPDTMPTEERGASAWSSRPDGTRPIRRPHRRPLPRHNRCHLIGHQLTAENANERNLITGTRYLNVEGMLPLENAVADYVEATGNRVLDRVTPVFVGDELVARGVQMEARSVEDGGVGVSFKVFCHNVQPGIEIDYRTGESRRSQDAAATGGSSSIQPSADQVTYVLNVNSDKFHLPDCPSVGKMADRNKSDMLSTYEEMIDNGHLPCGNCLPR